MARSLLRDVHRGAYRIRESPADPVPIENHPNLFKFSIVVTWALWSIHVIFEFGLARSLQNDIPHLAWRMWIALFAELCLSFQDVVSALNIVLVLFSGIEISARPPYRLCGESAPSIDVMVTCCGESSNVILNTVRAVAAQDYPSHRLRIFLLDDGHDEKLRATIEEFGRLSVGRCGPQVIYLSRNVQSGHKTYFKAGNLVFGIEDARRRGGSEFIAGLDADMIPERDWLRAMVPHLILDDKMGLACPPQRYYNVPEGDPLGQQADFDMFYTVQEVLNDRVGAAMCTGTGYVVRRSALEDIGGWPLAETGEDYMCSALLCNAGWKIAFVREVLQLGLAPESLRAILKQRMRWIDACIEVCQRCSYYLPGSHTTSEMTWSQRAVNILFALRDHAPLSNFVALIVLPFVLAPNHRNSVIDQSGYDGSLFWLQTLFLVSFLTHKIHTYILYRQIGLTRVVNFQSQEIWAAPYLAYRCFLSFLPAKFNKPSFVVVGTVISPENERSKLHRKPLPQRVCSPQMLMYMLYIIYASIPLMLCIQEYRNSGGARTFIMLFPGPLIKMLDCIYKVAVPLWYMTMPPTVPDRDQLVEEDEAGVKRPKKKWQREVGGGSMVWFWIVGLELSVIFLYLWL